MYKDEDKQREANRERQRRYKAKQKALPNKGVTDKALPEQGVTQGVTEAVFGQRQQRRGYGSPTSADNPKTKAWLATRNMHKRGLDIKTFVDLPLDVQQAIKREPKDQWGWRTTNAIHYQHLFPARYYPSGAPQARPV